jgi:hypothetical protein
MFLKVLECIHSVAEPKYFYEPLLLIFWINPELLPQPRGSSLYIYVHLCIYQAQGEQSVNGVQVRLSRPWNQVTD